MKHLLSTLGLALLAACGSGSAPVPSGTADFLVEDAPIDDLAAFRARLVDLRLVQAGAASTGNVLAAPVTLEFLSLQGLSAWLASSPVPTGTYDALTAVFEATSFQAVAFDGSAVAVEVLSNTLTTNFAAPVEVTEGGYIRFETDLDVAGSLTGEVSSGTIQFTASGSSSSSNGTFETPIDEIQGVVTAADPANQSLTMDAYADGDLTIPLGDVTVQVSGSTVLLGDDDAMFASLGDFFAFLVPGQSLLEVHGNLSSAGVVNATRIEVEDQVGGIGGGETVVRLEGLVQNLDPAGEFDLLIQDIEKGAALASSVLANLGNPTAIRVAFDGSTEFEFDDDIQTTSASLANGQTVDARFALFQTEPFPSFQIEIDLTPTVGIPAALDGSGGFKLSPKLFERFGLSKAPLVGDFDLRLDVPGLPGLSPDDLHPGHGARLDQLVASSEAAPRALFRAEQLVGATVVAHDPVQQTLFTTGGTLGNPDSDPAGPLRIHLERWESVESEAIEVGSLIDVFGLLRPTPGEWNAFRVVRLP